MSQTEVMSNKNAYKIAKEFKTQDIVAALSNFNEHTDRINEPHGNEIFMFFVKNPDQMYDWKCDGYNCSNDGANKKLPTKDPKISVSYHFSIASNAVLKDTSNYFDIFNSINLISVC